MAIQVPACALNASSVGYLRIDLPACLALAHLQMNACFAAQVAPTAPEADSSQKMSSTQRVQAQTETQSSAPVAPDTVSCLTLR